MRILRFNVGVCVNLLTHVTTLGPGEGVDKGETVYKWP